MKLQVVLSLALASALLFTMAACGSANSSISNAPIDPTVITSSPSAVTPAGKDTLVFALDMEPASLDPYMHTKQQGFTTATLMLETLIKKRADGTFMPWLAKSWEFVDDTTVIFKLRDDVTFHDGSKFTAEDARYSLALGAESSFSKTLFGSIDSVQTKALDMYTLELKLQSPYASLLEALSSFRGAMLCKASREAMGAEAYGRAPVGTGPMKFSRWIAGDRIEMDAYSGYWGEPLPFKKAVARIIVEASARAIELETGGVDIAAELAFSDWDRIRKDPDTRLLSGESQSISFILLNNSMEPFTDIRVRQALAHALDMDALVRTVYQGNATVADSYYIPSILGYQKVGPMEYNPVKSKQLLAEAGYSAGLTIPYYTTETQINLSVAEVVKNMWGQVGVDVDIKIIDLATLTALNNAGKCTVSCMAPAVAIPDPDAALMIWPIYRTISIRHNDPQVQKLLDQGRVTYDTAQRAAVYGELQSYLFSKTYNIPVAFPKAAFGTRAYVTGLSFPPSLVLDLTQVRFS
ncbi:MAG: ABC transporter substrate-binding protein [Oscillospiraceae bacterium]